MRLVYCYVKLTILVIRGNPGNEASVLQCEAHNTCHQGNPGNEASVLLCEAHNTCHQGKPWE